MGLFKGQFANVVEWEAVSYTHLYSQTPQRHVRKSKDTDKFPIRNPQ